MFRMDTQKFTQILFVMEVAKNERPIITNYVKSNSNQVRLLSSLILTLLFAANIHLHTFINTHKTFNIMNYM